MADLPPLTYHEARAILIADEALGLSFDARMDAGLILGTAESEAWIKLVESATHRIALYDGLTRKIG